MVALADVLRVADAVDDVADVVSVVVVAAAAFVVAVVVDVGVDVSRERRRAPVTGSTACARPRRP